ncbi:MAG: NAD(P)/FAD-dependent oxidoreductase, partial [Nitrososphaeraceae archaeon]|nr:NAD(P)/FAD-dependent oxidoreductase [Nitrososphaeraceae archaeon]
FDTRNMLENYGKAAEFLFSPFSQFGVKETFSFFESLGLPIVIQDRNRAFPKSEHAPDVAEALIRNLKKNKVEILSGKKVEQILFKDNLSLKLLIFIGIHLIYNLLFLLILYLTCR